MAQLETGIKDALLADTAITAIAGRRIRPLAVSGDDDRPYVTYSVGDRKTDKYLSGAVDADDYATAEFELGIYADTFDEVMDLSDASRDRLDQYGETISGVEFAPCEFDSETDVEQVVPEGKELPVYLRVQTYRALYRIV